MKCTDFWGKEKELKALAVRELAKAVEAHGNRYAWCDESGEVPEDVETPIVCVYMNYGPTDVVINEVIHDDKGWYFGGESTDECATGVVFDDPYDIANAFAIQGITEHIPETDAVKDVTNPESHELQAQVVALLDIDDLKQRGFDADKVSNDDLEAVAGKMLDMYLDNGFFDDMEEACIELNVPKIKEEEK